MNGRSMILITGYMNLKFFFFFLVLDFFPCYDEQRQYNTFLSLVEESRRSKTGLIQQKTSTKKPKKMAKKL